MNVIGSLIGQRFGELLIVDDKLKYGRRMLCAHCDCGAVIWIPFTQWQWKRPKNCGCRRRAKYRTQTKVWILHDGRIMSAWRFITSVLNAISVKEVSDLLHPAVNARIKKQYGVNYVASSCREDLERYKDGLKARHRD